MQLQIYIIFEKLWHKMSFKQRLKSSYNMTRLALAISVRKIIHSGITPV